MRPCLFLTAFEPAGKHFLSVCFFHPFADMHELGLNGARGQLRHGSQQVLPVRVQTLLVGNKLKLSCCPFLILTDSTVCHFLCRFLLHGLLVQFVSVFWKLAQRCFQLKCVYRLSVQRMHIGEESHLLLLFIFCPRLWLHRHGCINHPRARADATLLDLINVVGHCIQQVKRLTMILLVLQL